MVVHVEADAVYGTEAMPRSRALQDLEVCVYVYIYIYIHAYIYIYIYIYIHSGSHSSHAALARPSGPRGIRGYALYRVPGWLMLGAGDK